MTLRQLAIMIAILMAIAGGWVVWGRRNAPNEGQVMDAQDSRYATYRGARGELRVTFQYPKDWPVKEETGQVEAYREVRIKGPRNLEDTFTLLLAVRSSPLREHGGKFRTIEELIQHHLSHLFAGAKIVARKKRMAGGQSAEDITVAYTIPPLHQPGLKAIEIPVKSRTLFVESHGRLYELLYNADAREYDEHRDAFEQLLTTFHFQ